MSCYIDLYAGLLGCGKTTLIRQLLKTEYAGKKVAIIENEIGRVNLDAAVLRNTGVTIQELTSGCVCCTIQGDFTRAVEQLICTVSPEFIIIEPTGAADIEGLLNACGTVSTARLRRMVMLVNAKKLPMLLTVVGDFYYKQITAASFIYLNFTESMTQEEVLRVYELIRKINDHAEIVHVPIQEIDAETFSKCPAPVSNASAWEYSPDISFEGKGPMVPHTQNTLFAKSARKASPLQVISLDDKSPKMIQFGHTVQTVVYTWTLEIQKPLTAIQYQALIDSLSNKEEQELWRVKGVVRLDTGVIQRLDITFDDMFETAVDESIIDEAAAGKIVIIGTRINQTMIRNSIYEKINQTDE